MSLRMSGRKAEVKHSGADSCTCPYRPIHGRADFIAAAGESQVDQRHMARRRKMNIAGSHVAMHPTGRVQGVEGLGRLPDDPERFRNFECCPASKRA